jgi:acetyl/propionyl-CoA carboxylase alpha subunit
MRRALDEFVIEGIKTTIPFHRQLMDDPRYIEGDYNAFMDTFKMNDQNKSIHILNNYKSYTFLSVAFFSSILFG